MHEQVRAIRQQRRLRCSQALRGRFQAKQSIFAPLIAHIPTQTTSIQYRYAPLLESFNITKSYRVQESCRQ